MGRSSDVRATGSSTVVRGSKREQCTNFHNVPPPRCEFSSVQQLGEALGAPATALQLGASPGIGVKPASQENTVALTTTKVVETPAFHLPDFKTSKLESKATTATKFAVAKHLQLTGKTTDAINWRWAGQSKYVQRLFRAEQSKGSNSFPATRKEPPRNRCNTDRTKQRE